MSRYRALFGDTKPVIAMVHFGALPGAPLHDDTRGVEGILEDARRSPFGVPAAA